MKNYVLGLILAFGLTTVAQDVGLVRNATRTFDAVPVQALQQARADMQQLQEQVRQLLNQILLLRAERDSIHEELLKNELYLELLRRNAAITRLSAEQSELSGRIQSLQKEIRRLQDESEDSGSNAVGSKH